MNLYLVYLRDNAAAVFVEAAHVLGDEGAIEFVDLDGHIVLRVEAHNFIAWVLANHVVCG